MNHPVHGFLSGVALEELRPLSLHENHSWRSDRDSKDDNPKAYIQPTAYGKNFVGGAEHNLPE